MGSIRIPLNTRGSLLKTTSVSVPCCTFTRNPQVTIRAIRLSGRDRLSPKRHLDSIPPPTPCMNVHLYDSTLILHSTSPTLKDCFATLAMTYGDRECHGEERSGEAISPASA